MRLLRYGNIQSAARYVLDLLSGRYGTTGRSPRPDRKRPWQPLYDGIPGILVGTPLCRIASAGRGRCGLCFALLALAVVTGV